MARNSRVMRIFWRSSGMMKIAFSLPMTSPLGSNGYEWRRETEERLFLPSPLRSPLALLAFAAGARGGGEGGLGSRTLGRPRFHLVLLRLLGRRDDLGGPPTGGDLLQGRLGEMVRPDHQALAQFAVAQNTYPIGRPLG